jgi:hypothetical protein
MVSFARAAWRFTQRFNLVSQKSAAAIEKIDIEEPAQ